jgi:pantoate--beta-alanine ligase
MNVFREIKSLRSHLDEFANTGKSIGFVPTMGALHEAHLSLVRHSMHDNDKTVVSIFVNPKQFNNPEDLEHYPRTVDKDIELLEQQGCDIAFLPSVEEIYPDEVHRNFDFGHLDKVMEGRYRPGHFNGVAMVVERLFNIVKPQKAYFGLKDYQQLCIIEYMVKMLDLPIEIIPCPIIRESDGLAMSSRNTRLSPEQRKLAPLIYKTLLKVRDQHEQKSFSEIIEMVRKRLNETPGMELEYFEIVDSRTLLPVTSAGECAHCIACIAVYLGNVRLIDNILLN